MLRNKAAFDVAVGETGGADCVIRVASGGVTARLKTAGCLEVDFGRAGTSSSELALSDKADSTSERNISSGSSIPGEGGGVGSGVVSE